MSSETESSSNTKLRPSDVKPKLRPSKTTPLSEERAEAQGDSDEAKAHLDGVRRFYKLRTHWSWFLMACIAISLIFHISLTVLVGFKVVDFEKYQWFLPMVITENFAQIIALAIIVVKFLFSEPKSR
jgi:hypothetical protein